MSDKQNPDVCRSHHGGDELSEAANDSVQPSKAAMRDRIIDLLESRGTLSCHEIEEIMGWSHQGCSPRITELKQAGVIYKTDEKRKTRSGRNAAVYMLCERRGS